VITKVSEVMGEDGKMKRVIKKIIVKKKKNRESEVVQPSQINAAQSAQMLMQQEL
jgi:hypothetical protein